MIQCSGGFYFNIGFYQVLICTLQDYFWLFSFFISANFIARTFNGSPNRVMKPSASWWS